MFHTESCHGFGQVPELVKLLLMGDQIIVECLRRTVPQTAAVGEDTHFFAVFITPFAEHFYCFKVALQIPSDVETVEKIPQKLQSKGTVKFHIDRGASFDFGKLLFQHLCQKYGGSGNGFGQQITGLQISEDPAVLTSQMFRNGIGSVAVGVEKKIQLETL